ncbi:DUF6745 domain-containing protein [Microcoleus sp. herbarium14]|uniref:DUF6745 domain-containing protein n=1 Tax=Microcoleus sp. herbarium14 TaxID=3055439 RepID=UPI002FCF2700
MIKTFTPEQEALIPVYLEKWRKIALSTDPIDREKAAEAVRGAYALIDTKCPQILFFDSPYVAFRAIEWIENICYRLVYELYHEVRSNLWEQRSQKVWDEIHWLDWDFHTQLYRPLLNQLQQLFENELEPEGIVYSGCGFDFYISVLNCDYDPKEWATIQSLFKECGFILSHEDVCLVCDRPRILCFDSQHRLHAEAEPAIQFADGYSLYSYHGATLPEKYGQIHPNEWQPEWLLEEENAELKRVLIQGIGYDRICSELAAVELDTWQEYTLLKIDTKVDVEPIYLLKMTCPSTGFIHALRVPPDINSAREAIKWVNWGVDPEEFSVQT